MLDAGDYSPSLRIGSSLTHFTTSLNTMLYLYNTTFNDFYEQLPFPTCFFFFFYDICIHKPLKAEKTCYKMISWPEHAEDISIVLFESVSDLFAQEYNCLCEYVFLFYW